VFKRQVGAGADGQYRLRCGDDLPDMPNPMMVQPFLPKIVEEGEISFIFVDGEFSHALIKRAAKGDYRIQSTYGGTEEAITPSTEDLSDAKTILGALDVPPLYARVDMLRGEDGGLLLMEMELIEPYLYPVEGPELGVRMAAAVKKRLG
jgi:glutathione synthase/RimK-type ligase-like ATP-grasp enzyme